MKLVIKKNKTVKKKVKLMPTANNSKNILSLIGFDKVYKANTSMTSRNSILGKIKGVYFNKLKFYMKQFVSKINLQSYIIRIIIIG
jgi:hypothetical protein